MAATAADPPTAASFNKCCKRNSNNRGFVLLYSLVAFLVIGSASHTVMGQLQDDSSLLAEDKRNVQTLAKNGNLPFIRQELKKFVHPLTWQNNGIRMQEALDKRFSHPVASAWQSDSGARDLEDAMGKRFLHPLASAWQSDSGQRALEEALQKRFLHPIAWQSESGSRALQDVMGKRFSHPVASAWQTESGMRNLEDAIGKRFLHPVASAWQSDSGARAIEDAIGKRFSHPVASAWQSDSDMRDLDDALEKRFSHPVASSWQSQVQNVMDDDTEKRFNHPLQAAWLSGGPRTLADALDKRYVGSLARAGGLGAAGKRDDEEMNAEEDLLADALLKELVEEFLQRQQKEEYELEEEAENSLQKRFVASLARAGSLPAGKRNIAAMARDGYLVQHRPNQQDQTTVEGEETEDNEAIDSLIEEVNKRHLGALARGYNMPLGLTSGGKRNVGALARSGLLARLSGKRLELDEEKRNIASLLRGRLNGKRSPLRGQYLPFAYARLSGIRDSFNDKRNIQSLLKSWRPVDQYSNGNGKRYNLYFNNELPSTRRYVAALMNSPARVLGQQQNDEKKRHLGSLLGTSGNNKGFTVQKKSVPATSGVVGNVNSGPARSKRQIVGDEVPENTVEYPMPVLQGTDFYDFEEDSPAAAEEKRFLGSLARSGWIQSRQVRSLGPGVFEEGEMEKRHIGSLARIGWLPAFRSSRQSRVVRSSGPQQIGEQTRDSEEDGSPTWEESETETRQRRATMLEALGVASNKGLESSD